MENLNFMCLNYIGDCFMDFYLLIELIVLLESTEHFKVNYIMGSFFFLNLIPLEVVLMTSD